MRVEVEIAVSFSVVISSEKRILFNMLQMERVGSAGMGGVATRF
jgi:hypothetical protein